MPKAGPPRRKALLSRHAEQQRHFSNGFIKTALQFCVMVLLSSFLCGCGTMQKYWPSGKEWRDSTVNAARHPGTWIPLVAAGVVAAGNWDRSISDWAREKTPVFGSQESAGKNSDTFRALSHYGMLVSALAVPEEEDYWRPMIEEMAWEHIGAIAATTARSAIKKITDRDRPNGGTESFPSGHSTRAFAYVGMTYRNIDALKLDPAWEYGAKFTETCLGAATAWARVEAGAHFPTDVLAGAALGNFTALLIHDAFLGKDFPVNVQPVAEGGMVVTLQRSF